MPDIVISGDLSEVLAKLRRIKEVIDNRVAVGYPTLQHDETYRYGAFKDACPECIPLNGLTYRGDYIMSEFTQAFQLDGETVAVDKHGSCRCELKWIDKHEVLVERLFNEMEAA